jgi:hypothetical protein
MNQITSLPLLASLSLLISYCFFFATRKVLAVLEPVGAADPVLAEDNVCFHCSSCCCRSHASTRPTHTANRKAQHLLGMVHAKNTTKTIQTTLT